MTRTILISFFLILSAIAAAAQETVSPASFFIESIEVRNASRVSPEVIIAESRLRANAQYTEDELRDASLRLTRLPFLLSADFTLEKGSERGRHVLVITVSETKAFFYRMDIRPLLSEGDDVVTDFGSDLTSDNTALVGMRFFVGRRGSWHFGLQAQDDNRDYTTDYGAFAVGYTQYDLFGTRAFASINLKAAIGGGSVTPQIVVGIPLSPNQTLTLDYDHVGLDDEITIDGETFNDDDSQRVFTAQWSYDTTDHPFLPTKGTLLTATPVLAWRSRIGTTGTGASRRAIDIDSRSYGFDVSAARFFELSEKNSVSAAIGAGWGKTTEERETLVDRSYDSRYAVVQGGYSRTLRRNADGDRRLELSYRAKVATAERFANDPFFVDRSRFAQHLTASWVLRNAWGMLRLGLGFAW